MDLIFLLDLTKAAEKTAREAQAMNFPSYYEQTKHAPPSPLLIQALNAGVSGNEALDLGCGSGRDTRWLLQQKFRVTAIDHNPDALLYLQDIPPDQLTLVQSPFETFSFGMYDLINAQWSLPFIQKDLFEATFARIKQALRSDGLFAGQFFGIHDTWNRPGTGVTFCTREHIQLLLHDLQIITFEEREEDGTTASGQEKHWHVFHCLVRREGACEEDML